MSNQAKKNTEDNQDYEVIRLVKKNNSLKSSLFGTLKNV